MFKTLVVGGLAVSIFMNTFFYLMIKDSIRIHDHEVAVKSFVASGETQKNKRKVGIRERRIEKEIKCLTDNIYYEASHEPTSGKKAVGFVTMNRVNHKSFPDSVCEVVYQRTRSTCQFSWVCGVNKKYNHKEYVQSREIAKKLYKKHKKMYDVSNGSLYFHADYVKPSWASKKYFSTRIGRHLFYTGIPKKEYS